jgi:AcrR family transcriptional regulator
MSTSSRTYHHGDLRAELLRTAGEMLEKEGLASLRLRELARRAGVSHNAPYRHFPDRESLLAALAAEGFERLGAALQSRPRREMGEGYVEFALAHPQRFRLMFGGLVQLEHRDRRAYEALQKAFADLGDQAPYAAAAAWALVHGLSHLLLDGHFEGRDRKQFVRDVLSTVRFSAPRRA